jgi:hypothetical protein
VCIIGKIIAPPKDPVSDAQPEKLSMSQTLHMSHEQNVAKVRASLSRNSRTESSLFLNHDEEILQVVTCDGSNPRVQLTMLWIFKLIRTCCCWFFLDWNQATERVTSVLVLTNQRLIKFKESQGSLNGDFPKRCAILTLICAFFEVRQHTITSSCCCINACALAASLL